MGMTNEKDISKEKLQKKKSVKGKLLKIIIPLTAAIMLVILFVISSITKTILTDSANDLLTSESNANLKQLNGWTSGILAGLNAVKNTMETLDFKDSKEELDFLHTTKNINENFPKGVYGGDNAGKYIDADDWQPDAGFVVTERDWYKEGLSHENFAFGEPYVDSDSGQYVVSASTLLKKSESKKMVLSSDIFLQSIADYIAQVKIMDNGMSMIIDKGSGEILAHKDPTMIAYKINENDEDKFMAGIAKTIDSGSNEITKVDSSNGKYYVKSENIENTNWVLVSCVLEKEVLANLRSTQLRLVILSIVTIAVLAVVLERTVHFILKPVKGLTAAILKITDGDFTVDINAKGQDEIAVMGKALEGFITNMRGVIGNINDTSHILGSQSENSGNVSSTLYNLAEAQDTSMRELTTTVDELSKSISEIAENATTLASVVSEADSDGKDADQRMIATVQVAEKGRQDMQQVQAAMENIEESVQSLKTTVEEVGDSTKEINGIINLIGDIASQTNLLALNAAIEAARAGEYGRGFAVVAEEIRHLAETSSNAVQQINTLINDISSKVIVTVKQTKDSAEEIEDNVTLIDTACDTFDDIYDNINEASVIMKDMIKKVNNVDQVATNMAAITEEQSAGAQEILATSETLVEHSKKVTENSEIVAKGADELAGTSESLKDYMKRFKIN